MMKPKEIKITTLFFFVALASLFLILWLVDYSGFGIPELIPQLNLRTYGIMIMLTFILVHFLFQKILLNSNPGISVLKLTLLSTIITFFFFACLPGNQAESDFTSPVFNNRDTFFYCSHAGICPDGFIYSIVLKKSKAYLQANTISDLNYPGVVKQAICAFV